MKISGRWYLKAKLVHIREYNIDGGWKINTRTGRTKTTDNDHRQSTTAECGPRTEKSEVYSVNQSTPNGIVSA